MNKTNDGTKFEVSNRGYLSYKDGFSPASLTLFVPIAIVYLVCVAVFSDPSEWLAWFGCGGLIGIGVWFVCAVITCLGMKGCAGPHFKFSHDNCDVNIQSINIKEQYLYHDSYKEAITQMIAEHKINPETFPYESWGKVFHELNAAVYENQQILQKKKEETSYRNFAEAVRIENDILKGDNV